MSEKSQDKTKRKYLNYLTTYKWTHRYSVFYADESDSVNLISDMGRFKHELRRKYPDVAFLIRIQLLRRGELQAFLTITTTESDLDIRGIADKTFPLDVKVIDEHLTEGKLQSLAHAIDTQRPHNLERFFAKPKINRWSVLNKNKLIPIAATD